ncbi:Domain of unknown function (DUF4491) [Acididesulfobacillus acetoxydans]|uniref:DUF4491 family protein n=1 Tax=Acididesulfobacillus acetoxydans TaxID=1561005 RepID=A0A8S0Y3N1_9FIRM|nr:DUF4491 family protein [Acididesulfobacillus acetoxydans]CAA7602235.1 Domain of unknown function (DUF4491) [Acididesulfobacillus acetoxydans]CEJ07547.1 Domain of unknown function (DUF4491) [Acididesulfobacillus acetoxydans]
MNFKGVLIGLMVFVIIGAFHPIVIKSEYYFSKRIWPIFLLIGVLLLGASLFIHSETGSAIFGVIGFTCLWSIKELKEQEERVKKGWFPSNPKKRE